MRKLSITACALALALVPAVERLSAEAYAPKVTMSVKTPDGQTKELVAPESGLATLSLKDGKEFGFRPTMQDDKGTRVTVTIFNMNPSTSELGEVETGLSKPAAESKTSPSFRIAITKVGS